ncbi:MAG: AraC family transcriptional regulator [Rhodoferax sp.]|nr:AraC family transcriptional regulator [Rhodoferax sp.]MDP3653381.1 AraC family transcriptional regulator [Rhodoferax sp.]
MNNANPITISRLYVGEQHALYVGAITAGKHKHHAVQISVALMQPFRIRLGGGAWQECGSIIIRPDVAHEFDSASVAVANMFLDVESADYQVILQAEPAGGIEGGHSFEVPQALLQALRLFHGRVTAMRTAPELCTRMVEAFLGRRLLRKKIDPRVAQVLAMIGKEPAEKIQVERLADAVSLSSSRLAHLFAEQVGVPIRRYRLWKAIREAIRLCLTGASLTDAAHCAGFTDSAHFSNSFRDLFGMTPSLLLSQHAPVEILLGADSHRNGTCDIVPQS